MPQAVLQSLVLSRVRACEGLCALNRWQEFTTVIILMCCLVPKVLLGAGAAIELNIRNHIVV